uniref:Secreted protein n=1 Tax=Panagrellus redivivus TaxID=6233 RepID=A0A7E5A139_PANRE
MLNQTHFFVFSVAITISYGFYIITADDESFGYPSDMDLPAAINSGSRSGAPFVPELLLPGSMSVLDDGDDEDYLERIGRLQHALRAKKSTVTLAELHSQNIRPLDLDGVQLVRNYEDDSTDNRIKRSSAPVEYVILG